LGLPEVVFALTVLVAGFLSWVTVDDEDFTPVKMGESTFTVPVVDEFLFENFSCGAQRLIPQHLIMYPLLLMPVCLKL
jgi:hypothetical protein